MTRIVAYGSSKGGVAKSTETLNQPAVFARYLPGIRHLVVNADDNRSVSDCLKRTPEHLLPGVDVDAVEDPRTLTKLRRLAEQNTYDLIWIDLPGAKRTGELRALLDGDEHGSIPDLVIVPMTASTFDLRVAVRAVREESSPGVDYGVLLNGCKTPARCFILAGTTGGCGGFVPQAVAATVATRHLSGCSPVATPAFVAGIPPAGTRGRPPVELREAPWAAHSTDVIFCITLSVVDERFDPDLLDEADPFEIDSQAAHLFKHPRRSVDDIAEVWASDPLWYPATPPAHWLMCGEVAGTVLVVPLAPAHSGDPHRCRPIGCYEATGSLADQYWRDR